MYGTHIRKAKSAQKSLFDPGKDLFRNLLQGSQFLLRISISAAHLYYHCASQLPLRISLPLQCEIFSGAADIEADLLVHQQRIIPLAVACRESVCHRDIQIIHEFSAYHIIK